MSMTLSDAAVLSQDMLVKGIIETLIKESPILPRLSFQEVEGTAYTVTREDKDNMGTVHWRQVNGVWTESTAKYDEKNFHLMRLGEDAVVDNFLQQTQSDRYQLMAQQVQAKSRLMAHAFDEAAIYGNEDAYEPDGFHTMVDDNDSTFDVSVHCGTDATGGPLSIAKLEEAIDKMLVGPPTFALMNRTIRRRFDAYLRSKASYQVERDEWGRRVTMYADFPILTSDHLLQTEAISDDAYSAKTGGLTSSVFLVYASAPDGVHGIQNKGIQYETWDKLETADGGKTRIKWYVSLAQGSPYSVVRIDGITDAAVTD